MDRSTIMPNTTTTTRSCCFLVLFCFCGLAVLLMSSCSEAKPWVVPRGRWWARGKAFGAGRGPYYFVGKRDASQGYCLANSDCPPSHCCMERGDGSGISTCTYRPKTGEICYPKPSWADREDDVTGRKLGQGHASVTEDSCDCAAGSVCVTLSRQGFGLCVPEPDSSPFVREDDILED